MTYMSEIHAVSITNDNAKPTDIETKPLKLLKNILEHSILLLYNQYTDTSAKNPLTASFVFKYSTTFFCIICLLLLHNALDIQDSSLLRT